MPLAEAGAADGMSSSFAWVPGSATSWASILVVLMTPDWEELRRKVR